MTEDEGQAGEPTGSSSPPSRGPRERPPRPAPGYEEVTLADLLDVLLRRRTLVVATFLIVLAGSVAVTALTPPTYEAEATVVPTNEKDTILSVLDSQAFATDVAQRLGLVDELGDGNATLAGARLAERLHVEEGTQGVRDDNRAVITITAEASSSIRAWQIAQGSMNELADWRPYLRNVTWDRNWQTYYEQAGKDEQKAQEDLQALVAGMDYYRPLDRPSVPTEPVSPSWALNTSLGAVLGAMLALFVPFLVEGVQNALDERRKRDEADGAPDAVTAEDAEPETASSTAPVDEQPGPS